jgi:tRNA threonylcarbamoyladenosine biosynthesis protein TsaB
VRILAIETATVRGSVALVENGVAVASAVHAEPNAHAERLLLLLDPLLAEAGWPRSSLTRVGVGVGPGSFTGLRVGIALAQGLALGLDIPVFGVGSLAAMAHAAPPAQTALRCPVLDARRGEVFVAVYDAAGVEVAAPQAVAYAGALAALDQACGGRPRILLGEAAAKLSEAVFRSASTDLPHARETALLAAGLPDAAAGAVPIYVRGPGAVKPELPPSPLAADEV